MDIRILSLRSRRQNRAWDERDSAQPQGYGATNPIKPANAVGSIIVVRAFIIIEVGSITVPASRPY